MRSFLAWILIFCCLQVLADPQPSIQFIANRNQWRKEIFFRAPVEQGHVNFYANKIQYDFRGIVPPRGKDNVDDAVQVDESGHVADGPVQRHVLQVSFLNADPASVPSGRYPSNTKFNYYLGNDRTKWASAVRAYSYVNYNEIYCGVGLQYYSQDGMLKYEWIVAPDVDPAVIRMQYDGADYLSLENGNLHLKTSVNEMWEMKPFAYQWKEGKKIEVACEYVVKKNVVTYFFPDGYDSCEPLIIDPILVFSAYSGSSLDNWGNTATYDSRGNVYSGGMVRTEAPNLSYPITIGAYQEDHGGGAWDVGILKYDSSGSHLLYCTYLGGAGTETPQSLVVNKDDELLILGATSSHNFPITNASTFKGGTNIDPLGDVPYNGTDMFVARLSEDGAALIGATYIGGSSNDAVNFISGNISTTTKQESPLARNYGDQLRGDIITDQDNFVYIASNTLSANFPIVNSTTTFGGGSHDAVVVKLQPNLSSIVWSRYIGGSGTDAAYSIKLDADNHIFVAGGTQSTTIPGLNGFKTTNTGNIDGWVMSLATDGTTLDGTMIGTTAYDQCYFVDLDPSGNVFLYGQTQGSYPVSDGTFNQPNSGQFIQMLSHNLKDPIKSTVIGTRGNSPNISPTAFMVSDCGYIYFSGWGGRVNAPTIIINNNGETITRNYVGGNTIGMPITSNAYQPTTGGNDFYLAVISYDMSALLYSTFLGGTQSATHVDGGTSRFDKAGTVYHAVCAGCGGRSDFPAVNVPPAHRRNRSINCNNAVFKFDLSLLRARIQTNSIRFDDPGKTRVCIPDTIVFENLSVGGKEYQWDLGDGTRITTTNKQPIYHRYLEKDKVYIVWLKAIDPGTCKVRDSTWVRIYVYKAEADVQDDDVTCEGTSYMLQASGGDQYFWRSKDGTFQSNLPTPTFTAEDSMIYYIDITETNGCVYKDTVQLDVIPVIVPEFDLTREGDCMDLPSVYLQNNSDSLWDSDIMFFDFGDGVTSDQEIVTHDFEAEGTYTIKLVGVREAGDEVCVTEKVEVLPVYFLKIPNVITPADKNSLNDVFFIQYSKQEGVSPADFGLTTSVVIYNRWGGKVFEDTNYQYNWKGDGVQSGIYYFEVTVEGRATCKGWLHVMK